MTRDTHAIHCELVHFHTSLPNIMHYIQHNKSSYSVNRYSICLLKCIYKYVNHTKIYYSPTIHYILQAGGNYIYHCAIDAFIPSVWHYENIRAPSVVYQLMQ